MLWLWTEDLQIKESTSNLIQQGQVQATHPDHKGREYFYHQICLTDNQD